MPERLLGNTGQSLPIFGLGGSSRQTPLSKLDQESAAVKIEEAKAQKIIRFSGITGHHEPDIIVKGLERYPFDTTLIPVNAAERHHPRSFISQVLPVAQRKNIGVIAMKVPAYGKLLSGVLDGMAQAMGYSLSQPGVHCCIIAADSVEQLAANVAVAQGFQPLSQTAIAQIEQRTAAQWEDNTFFRAWT
jgi:predicted aldo/keto reductase-like oxidoreductase